MNTQMDNPLPSEKLDWNHFESWEYKICESLVGQGYWKYKELAQDNEPNPTLADYTAWSCLASCVHDHMLGYIQDAKIPKEAWGNLKKIFAANMAARKLQLRQELINIQQKDLSITNYTLKIKELCDSLGSINVNIDDDEMVQICLSVLTPWFNPYVGNPHEGKPSLLFRSPIDVTGGRKPRSNEKQHI